MRERRRRMLTAGSEDQKADGPGLLALTVGTFFGAVAARLRRERNLPHRDPDRFGGIWGNAMLFVENARNRRG